MANSTLYNLQLIFVARGCVRCHERFEAAELCDVGGQFAVPTDGARVNPHDN